MDRGSQLDEEDEEDENDKDDEEEEEDEEAGGRRRKEAEATNIKSNNPHLAGGEKHLQITSNSHWPLHIHDYPCVDPTVITVIYSI